MTGNDDDGRTGATDLLGRVLLGLVGAQVFLRLLLHGAGAGLGTGLLVDAMVWMAGLVWAGRAAQEGRLRVGGAGLGAPLVAYAIVCGLSPIIASHKLPAFEAASSVVSSILLYFLLVNLPDRRRALTAAVSLLTAAALANVVLGLFQVFVELPDLRRQYPPGIPIPGIDPQHEPELRWRMETGEATGTFVLSNTMAAFLVLVLPAAVVLAARAWRRDARGEAAAWTGLGAALVTGLWATGSRGGWAAAVVSLAALAALRLWARVPRSRGPLLAAAALVLFAAALLGATGVLTAARLRAAHPSIAFRLDFWSAALRVVDEAPLAGVGLGNFGEHYTRWKAPGAQETVRAHSAILDAWAETGLIGVVAFASIWVVMLLWAMKRSEVGRNGPASDGPRGLGRHGGGGLAAGAAAGAALACLLGGGAWMLVAVGAALAWLLWLARRGVDPAAAAPALAAGAIGGLAHAVIDIDWSVPSMTEAFLLLLAAWACAREPDPAVPAVDVPVRRAGAVAALVPFLVATVVLAGFLVPRAIRSEMLLDRARETFDQARRASEAGKASKDRDEKMAMLRRVVGHYREAARMLREAQVMNPWDAQLYEELGRYGAAVLPAFEGVGDIESEVEFEQAKGAVEAAIALCPEAAGLYAQKGTLWDIRADLLFGRREQEKDEGRKERLDRRHRAAVSAALEAYDAAVERYPTRAWYRFLRAVAYGRQGRFAEERADLRRALELHAAQDLERLRLPGDIVQGIGERLKEIGGVEPAPPKK